MASNQGKNIVIGTHGTALSSILNYFKPEFGCSDFLRIIDWMPYIVGLDFEGHELVDVKEFKGNTRADKPNLYAEETKINEGV